LSRALSLDFPPDFAQAVSDDASSLAVLHDRELTAPTIAALQAAAFPTNLGLLPTQPEIWQYTRSAVCALASSQEALDDLAAAYAELYLTGALGVSACESAWLDEDNLLCQAPMFELRALYRKAGLVATNWRMRSEDHVALQLTYIAHCAQHAQGAASWQVLADMLDQHLLLWMPQFAQQAAQRGAHPFYAGLAAVSAHWLDRLRDILAAALETPRPAREDIIARRAQAAKETAAAAAKAHPVHFVPGGNAPSW
jgi:TorA maturation chaperone TorD